MTHSTSRARLPRRTIRVSPWLAAAVAFSAFAGTVTGVATAHAQSPIASWIGWGAIGVLVLAFFAMLGLTVVEIDAHGVRPLIGPGVRWSNVAAVRLDAAPQWGSHTRAVYLDVMSRGGVRRHMLAGFVQIGRSRLLDLDDLHRVLMAYYCLGAPSLAVPEAEDASPAERG